jgi:NAD(P)-dependent dehydrogenase (short-subunit alcohol dehydrogenase family)
MRGLDGKVALITGATKDMGAAIARRLAAEGAAILGVGRSEALGERVAEDIRRSGGRASFLCTDITDENQVQRAVSAAVELWGRLDIVVHNAAAVDVIQAGSERPLAEESSAAFDQMLKVGIYGPFWLSKYAIPEMIRAGSGAFISISSLASLRAVPSLTSYSVSKAGLEALTRQIAVDYGPHGIRANSVLVGSIDVAGTADLHAHPVAGPMLRGNQMLERHGVPEDVAAMVAFLASEEAAFVTGGLFPVDAGASVKQNVPDLSGVYDEIQGQA